MRKLLTPAFMLLGLATILTLLTLITIPAQSQQPILLPASTVGEDCCESWGGTSCIHCCSSNIAACWITCGWIAEEYRALCEANCVAMEQTCEPACITCSIDDPF